MRKKMTQLINDFHEKSKTRAEELANKLGVDFKPLEYESIELKARKRIETIQKYRERKDEYDALLNEVFKVVSPEEVIEFLKNYQTK